MERVELNGVMESEIVIVTVNGIPQPVCGDGNVDSGEACGEPNHNTCASDETCVACECIPPTPVPDSYCGDGNVDSGEACGEPKS